LNEVRILASIDHPNIISYKEAFFEEATQTLCIVMEYADGGDLQSKINQLKKS
jgi:NIMA (never in mitosis gene a)-related kinase